MAFDLLTPLRGASRSNRGEVRACIYRKGKHKTLTFVVSIGGQVAEMLGARASDRVNIEVGQLDTADRGKVRVSLRPDGKFGLSRAGKTDTLRVGTSNIHPSLVSAESTPTAVKIQDVQEGVLLLRLPDSMLRTGSLMADGLRRRP